MNKAQIVVNIVGSHSRICLFFSQSEIRALSKWVKKEQSLSYMCSQMQKNCFRSKMTHRNLSICNSGNFLYTKYCVLFTEIAKTYFQFAILGSTLMETFAPGAQVQQCQTGSW